MKATLGGILLVAAVTGGSCVSAPRAGGKPPGFPAIAAPTIPASLAVSDDIRNRHDGAWTSLQAGDLRTASRAYQECLRLSGAFYPAEAGLGLVALASRDFKSAVSRFRSALARDDRYVPAWRGLVDAELGAGSPDDAITALERLLALDASQERDRERLEVLRLRQLQSFMDAAARARAAGQLDEAERLLGRALVVAPRSAIVLRELSSVQLRSGQLEQAEAHARQAIENDANDAGSYGLLAEVLDARGRVREAASALARAAAIDPAWRDRAAAAAVRADEAALPPEMRDLRRLPSVTRGQLAALVGTRLPELLARAPRRAPVVATDVRTHWAAPWIVAVTQAGVMDVFANHTFQPGATVQRGDLAQAVSVLVTLALSGDAARLSRWEAARPTFADLGPSNLLYPAAALSVSAGALAATGGRFEPTRLATGAEALDAVARIEALAGRGSR